METDKITSSYRKCMGETQNLVDVVLQKNDDCEIVKVLTSTAKAYVDDVEVLNGEARYSGGVVFDCLYVDEQGKTHIMSDTAELNGKIENPSLNPLMKPIYKVEVVEVKVTSLDGDKVKLTATVEIKLDVIVTDEIEQVKVNNGDIQVLKEVVSKNTVVSSGTKTFNISEEFEVKSKVNKVMLSQAHLTLNETTGGTGYFTTSGEMFVNSILEVQDDESTELKNFMETISFKEELEDELVQKDDKLYTFAYVRPQDLTISVVTDENEGNVSTISVNAIVCVKYIAVREAEVEVYCDAFSLTNKTNIVTDTIIIQKNMTTERYKAVLEGQTVIGEEEPRIAKVVAVADENISIANANVYSNQLTVEGIAYATVVYLTDDDIPALNSIVLEIPFSNKFDANNLSNYGLFVRAEILDVEVKAKKGKELNASIEVKFVVDSYVIDNEMIIKDIELTEEIPQADHSLEIFIAPKGSTIWDIAKRLLVSEELLLEQNPELVFPLQNSQSIVYFKQRTE